MTIHVSADLNRQIAQRYGSLEDFRARTHLALCEYSFSRRAVAIRAGLCYSHVIKVLNGEVRKPQLETMLMIDEAVEQLVNDATEEERHE